jgi:Fe2+ or Zn2+ uptake regulation protein
MGKEKIRIRASEVVRDLRAGLSDKELMQQYRLTPKLLRYVLRKLVEAGRITEMEFYERTMLSESSLFKAFSDGSHESLKCHRCGRTLTEEDVVCSFCTTISAV